MAPLTPSVANRAYKITRGLIQKYGPERVIDTPITEAGASPNSPQGHASQTPAIPEPLSCNLIPPPDIPPLICICGDAPVASLGRILTWPKDDIPRCILGSGACAFFLVEGSTLSCRPSSLHSRTCSAHQLPASSSCNEKRSFLPQDLLGLRLALPWRASGLWSSS